MRTALGITLLALSIYILFVTYKRSKRNQSPEVLPWFKFASADDAIARLHRMALVCKRPGSFSDKCKYAVVWPLLSLGRSLNLLVKNGRFVAREYGVGLWSQFGQLMYPATFHNWAPKDYYLYRFWEKNRSRVRLYFQNFEVLSLMKWLHRELDSNLIDDKLRFFEMCRQNNLKTAPVILAFVPGQNPRWVDDRMLFPAADLTLKSTKESRGIGVEKWFYRSASETWKHGEAALDQSGLISYCAQRASKAVHILQPTLKNHPSVAPFCKGGLCTLRLLSCRFLGQEPRVLLTTWRMPAGEAYVDNFYAAGLAAAVSPSGELTTAVCKNLKKGFFTCHPDTGAPIKGTTLPGFRQMVDLALSAHSQLKDFLFVGWDVAFTTEGPVLLEGNTDWCGQVVQMPNDQPLGETEFVEIIAQQLENLKHRA